MTTATNMYALTWSAALATQDGLATAIKTLDKGESEVEVEPFGGLLIAQAGQLAHLCTDVALSKPENETAKRETLNALATSSLFLQQDVWSGMGCGSGLSSGVTSSLLKDIHDARMNVSAKWFKEFAKKSPSVVPMPSSLEESTMLYWSVLLEDPAALKGLTGKARSFNDDDTKAGLQMALASLAALLPYYGDFKSGLALAQENVCLAEFPLLVSKYISSIHRIAGILNKITPDAQAAFVDLRGVGGAWSLWNQGAGVQNHTHFKRLPHFDPS